MRPHMISTLASCRSLLLGRAMQSVDSCVHRRCPRRQQDLLGVQRELESDWDRDYLTSYKPALSVLFNSFILAQARLKELVRTSCLDTGWKRHGSSVEADPRPQGSLEMSCGRNRLAEPCPRSLLCLQPLLP